MSTPELAFLAGHALDVYGFKGCPDCSRLERWLETFGVRHAQVDIHAQPQAAERLERETGKQAVPFILLDGRTWVRGYHKERPGRFDAQLLLAELREALG